MKIKGYRKLKRGDIVTFNQVAPNPSKGERWKTLRKIPVDARNTMIKRIVALSGDEVETRYGQVYINGKPDPYNEKRQYTFVVSMTERRFKQILGDIVDSSQQKRVAESDDGIPRYEIALTNAQIRQVQQRGEDVYNSNGNSQNWKLGSFSSHSSEYLAKQKESGDIDRNSMKAFPIPSCGDRRLLNKDTHPLTIKMIEVENPDFKVVKEDKNTRYFIGQKEISSYEFKGKNYFLPGGDNFHNSFDGFEHSAISTDYIDGTAVVVLFGAKNENILRNLITLNLKLDRFFKWV